MFRLYNSEIIFYLCPADVIYYKEGAANVRYMATVQVTLYTSKSILKGKYTECYSYPYSTDIVVFLVRKKRRLCWLFGQLNGHVSSLTRHWSYVHPVNPEKESEKKKRRWLIGTASWYVSIGGGQL